MAKKTSKAAKIGVGVGVTALAAAAAATYFFYGKDGAKHRAQAKRWAGTAKKEVVSRLRKLRSVNQKSYNQVVEAVTKKYGALKTVGPKEAQLLAKELKAHWQSVNRTLKKKTGAKKRK